MRRLVLLLLLLGVLAGGGVIAWNLLDLPPLRLVLKYGYPSPMGPTGRTLTVEGVEFVEISPGYFRMGSHYRCEKGNLLGRVSALVGLPWGTPPKHGSRECPPHYVEFADGFWMARYEVTNAQYERFEQDREGSGFSPGDRHPVVNVSWEDAQAYCRWLADQTGKPIRLPSESEWEGGCRAGSETEYAFGDDAEDLGAYAWCDQNSRGSAHEVGTRAPNAWGLCDLHGNVWEWCEDSFHENYRGAPGDGFAWTEGGVEVEPGSPIRVGRGGSWISPAEGCRSACRYGYDPADRWIFLGFRPAFSPSAD